MEQLNGIVMENTKGFGLYLDRTVKTIELAFQKMFKENAIDLTIEQWVFLQRIHELGGETSQKELTDLNFRTRATTSKMITNLVKLGYVDKSRFEGDLKRFKLCLTPTGEQLVEEILPFVQELRLHGLKGISKEDFQIFLHVLDQIWSNYKVEDS